MMKKADSSVPPQTTIEASQRTPDEIRLRPKRSRPTKADSRKKAKIPSAASGAPKMSPTIEENLDQLVPNSNSITSPLTTPTTKVTAKSSIRKIDSRS